MLISYCEAYNNNNNSMREQQTPSYPISTTPDELDDQKLAAKGHDSSPLNSFYPTGGDGRLNLQQMISFVFLFVILFLGWIVNCTVIIGLRKDRRLAHITYFYVISLCVAMLLMAALDFPPAIIYDTFGNKSLMDIVCIAWIYMDTFLCNVVFLHVFGASLDSYLRLRNPCRYVHSTQRGSTWLKLAAPWGVSFIQTTTQFAITRRYTGLFNEGVCLLEDPNFLILRSAMSYGLPMFASVILIFLAVKQLRDQRFLSQEALFDLVKSYHGSSGFDEQTQCLWSDSGLDYDENDKTEDDENDEDEPFENAGSYGEQINFNRRLNNKRRIPASSSCGQISTITRDLTTETFVAQSQSSDHLRMPPIPELVEHVCPKHGRLAYPHNAGSSGQPDNQGYIHGTSDEAQFNEYSPASCNYQSCYPMQVIQSSLSRGEQINYPSITSANIHPLNSHVHYTQGHCTCSERNSGQPDLTYYIPPPSSNVENNLRLSGRAGSLNRISSPSANSYSSNNGVGMHHTQHPLSMTSSPTMMTELGASTLPLQRKPNSFSSPLAKDNSVSDMSTTPQEEQGVTTISQICSETHSPSMQQRKTGRNQVRISWGRVYKTEKAAIALNMVSCIVSIGLWSPFMLATLLHGLCKPPLCTLDVSTKRLAEFKWLAYASVLVYGLLFLIVDKRIRQAAIRAVLCRK